MQERRLHPRAVVRLPAQVSRGKDLWDEALLFDLSCSGAGIHTRSRLPLQSEIRLRFSFPAGEAGEEIDLEVAALTVRTGPPETAAPDFAHVSGVHFLDLHGETFDRVRAHVWQLVNRDD